jgi:hypothetical protein
MWQDGDYVDYAPINRCARVKAAGHTAGRCWSPRPRATWWQGRLGGGFG